MALNFVQDSYRAIIIRMARLILLVIVTGLTSLILIGIWARSVAHSAASPSDIAGEVLPAFYFMYGIVATIILAIGAKNRMLELQLIRRNRRIVSRR